MQIDITILDEAWETKIPQLEAFCLPIIQQIEIEGETELSVVFSNDAHVHELNQQYRQQDKSTNVLSFPVKQIQVGDPPPPMLGDVILALETIEAEAAEQEKLFEQHLAHLLLHGTLHLLGYDHLNDTQAEQMETLEKHLLEKLNFPDPYI